MSPCRCCFRRRKNCPVLCQPSRCGCHSAERLPLSTITGRPLPPSFSAGYAGGSTDHANRRCRRPLGIFTARNCVVLPSGMIRQLQQVRFWLITIVIGDFRATGTFSVRHRQEKYCLSLWPSYAVCQPVVPESLIHQMSHDWHPAIVRCHQPQPYLCNLCGRVDWDISRCSRRY